MKASASSRLRIRTAAMKDIPCTCNSLHKINRCEGKLTHQKYVNTMRVTHIADVGPVARVRTEHAMEQIVVRTALR